MIQKITQEDGDRFYQIGDEFYPSSTTILEARPMPFGLKEWLKDKTRAEGEKLLHEAALSGSKIHHTIELMLKGVNITPGGLTDDHIKELELVEPELVSYLKKPFSKTEDKKLRGFMNWWEEYQPETMESEKIVYSRKHKYAGTMDWLGYIHIKGKKTKRQLVMIDWKTGKGLYKEYDLQVASYLKAYNGMSKKKVKHAALLQLGVNKVGYKFQFVKDIKQDFKRFMDTKKIWDDINPEAKPNIYQFADVYQLLLN